MKLTEEQCKKNSHISTEEILQDIEDTKKEVQDYEDLLEVYYRDRQKNKLPIYMTEGKVSRGKDFIESLESILEFRKKEEENA